MGPCYPVLLQGPLGSYCTVLGGWTGLLGGPLGSPVYYRGRLGWVGVGRGGLGGGGLGRAGQGRVGRARPGR